MALLGKEKYSAEEAERIYEYLSVYHDRAQPIQYEIIVDNFKAVRRTDDLSMFHVYENFIKPKTKAVEFLLFTGNSNNNDKYILYFGEDEQKGLSGLEVEKRIQDGIDREKRNWEFDQLRRENQELKEDLNQQDKEIEGLEKEIERLEREREEMLSKQSPLKGVVGEIGASVIESMIRRNPKTIARIIPGGEALSGLLEQEAKQREEETPLQEAEVVFTPKSSSGMDSLKEEDKETLSLLKQIQQAFNQEEYEKVIDILDSLLADKTKISTIHEMLQ
jgi:hypothetical protein